MYTWAHLKEIHFKTILSGRFKPFVYLHHLANTSMSQSRKAIYQRGWFPRSLLTKIPTLSLGQTPAWRQHLPALSVTCIIRDWCHNLPTMIGYIKFSQVDTLYQWNIRNSIIISSSTQVLLLPDHITDIATDTNFSSICWYRYNITFI